MTIRLHFFAFSSDSPSIRWRANAIHPPCRLYNGIYGYIIIYTYTCCVLPSSQLSLRYCCCCCSSSAQFDNDYDCFGDFPNRGQWRADFLTWATPPLLFCPLAPNRYITIYLFLGGRMDGDFDSFGIMSWLCTITLAAPEIDLVTRVLYTTLLSPFVWAQLPVHHLLIRCVSSAIKVCIIS